MATSSTSSTSSSTTAATIGSQLATSFGGGTGLDMTALANNLADAQYVGRLSRLDSQSSTLETRISQASTLRSQLLSLASSLGDRVRTGDLAARPTVANALVASASLPLGSAGVSGSYSLEVTKLAAPQVLASQSFTNATDPVGSGSLTISFGTVAGSSFTADPARTGVSVPIAAGATLNDVANAINGAGTGVTAYVAQGASGPQLVFKGQQGAINGFTISATEDPAEPGLSRLNYAPGSATTTATLASPAVDAAYKLDGISRTSTTNTIAEAAPGLALKLTATNIGAPTQVTFADPASAISTALQDLTGALNAIVTEMKADTNPVSGTLFSDSGARTMARRLSQLTGQTVMPNAANGAPKTLADLGMTVSKDGTFSFDATRLATAITNNRDGVAAMFTVGVNGVYGTMDRLSRDLSSSSDPGALGGSVKRYTDQRTKLTAQRAELVKQQDKLRTQLIDRFARTNSRVASANSTLTYLQNQVQAWSNQSG